METRKHIADPKIDRLLLMISKQKKGGLSASHDDYCFPTMK